MQSAWFLWLGAICAGGCAAQSETRTHAPGRTVGFTCDVPRGALRSCTYADVHGRVRFDDSAAKTLKAYVADGGSWQPLPRFYGNTLWAACGLVPDSAGRPRPDHVRFADLNGDGRYDVIVVGYCITGIGPTGAQPFAVGTIYMQQAPARYSVDDARDSTLTDALPESCSSGACDVLTAARAAVRTARPAAASGRRDSVR